MVQEKIMYTVICDNCRKDSNEGLEYSCWTDAISAKDVAMDSEWIMEGENHYCPDCVSYDDEDNLVLKKVINCIDPVKELLPNLDKSTENLSKIKDKDKWINELRGKEEVEHDCLFCGKTIRQQKKGCNQISCYRQHLQRKDKNQELIDKLDSVIVYGHNLSEQQKNKIEEIVMQYFTEKVKSLHNKYDHGEVNNIYNMAIFDVLEILK